ncbi:MAG: DUF5606 domain-containing protein [Dysgonamonadaceae bacterium]|jgi:hypothetical protein|nr:DUF5606 domain-containing protein [Dysgonamonadaceae bacterium]
MLKEILSISGKPGLFKRISQGKNLLIAESLLDGKRIPLYSRDKVIALGDISIYSTGDEDKPLYEIFIAIQAKEEGKQVEFDANNPVKLKEYLYSVFPDFDSERVYPSDIRKLLNWYNILVSKGLTDFAPEVKETIKKDEPKELSTKPPKKAINVVPKEARKKSVDKSRRIKQG